MLSAMRLLPTTARVKISGQVLFNGRDMLQATKRELREIRGRDIALIPQDPMTRSEEHTSELQSLMRISYAVFCLKKKKRQYIYHNNNTRTKQQHQNTQVVRQITQKLKTH